MIKQLTVFLTNEKGRLAAACRVLADAGINLRSLNVADTADFGVARIICDNPDDALQALQHAGYRAAITDVVAVCVPDVLGGLADLLAFMDTLDVNIEYGYCFVNGGGNAIDILKVDGGADVEERLIEAGYVCPKAEDVYNF
ncbi:MAG: ACT domain-containing protein [Eggerthellaceae bacterium]|nr:ACT domain-containing protein [Eggerthellaceae bacterium]